LLDQFCRIKFLIIFFISLGSFPAKTFSEENPGIIESLERLIEVHKKQFDQNQNKVQSNFKILSEISSLKELKLDPQFMRSLLFHSDDKYLRLAQKNECKFLSVLESNLLRISTGEVTNILVTFKNAENNTESAAIPKNDFFDLTYKNKCLNNREFTTIFSEANFKKTIEGIKFSIPKTKSACLAVHQEWLDNSFTPYLCRINQILKTSKDLKLVDQYQSKIGTLQKIYIENLCNNLTSPDLFCESYLKQDTWNAIINGEAPTYKMSYKCQNLMGKTEELTLNDLKNCGSKLIKDPSICETRGNKNFLSDFPLQNCDNISDALKKSKLKTNYHDCPSNVDNEAITNIHRVVNHFAPRNIKTSKETCAGEAHYTFARLNFDIKHDEGWPLKICYMNRVTDKEVCVPYIPGSREDDPRSEDQVIAKIIYLQKGAPAKTKCRIVDSKTYNPLRSEFKFGCFIVYDADTCTTLSCNKKVIWEEKTIADIKFIGTPVVDYFPTAFINERYAFDSMINELIKTQGRSIKNLTDLKFFLDKIPNSIVHGVGCAEDLMPEEFERIGINQCHPLPFIIDGHLLKNNETWLVFRSAIDDLHSPRLILWHNIFNAVSAYRELHPLNTWTLYGIKQ
jgi:hypothetical protein